MSKICFLVFLIEKEIRVKWCWTIIILRQRIEPRFTDAYENKRNVSDSSVSLFKPRGEKLIRAFRMARNGWEWLRMARNGWEWIGNGCEWVGMNGNGCEWVGMNGNGCESVGMNGNGRECPNSFSPLGLNCLTRSQVCIKYCFLALEKLKTIICDQRPFSAFFLLFLSEFSAIFCFFWAIFCFLSIERWQPWLTLQF